jgi:hypothetical protein
VLGSFDAALTVGMVVAVDHCMYTILIVVLVIFLLGGGGFYFRGRR